MPTKTTMLERLKNAHLAFVSLYDNPDPKSQAAADSLADAMDYFWYNLTDEEINTYQKWLVEIEKTST